MKACKTLVGAALFTASCSFAVPRAAATAPDFLKDEALFWLDASTLDLSAGQDVVSWPDVRGVNYHVATTYTDIKPKVIEIESGELAGKKAVTFFNVGTVCDMHFESNMLVKTVFFVMDIDQDRKAYLLGADKKDTGDPLYWAFDRANGGMYRSSNSNALPSTYYDDGKKIASPSSTVIPTGYRLITWCATDVLPYVRNLTQDRNVADRVGGKRLCELIAFTRSLSDKERSEVEGYLHAKWFGRESQAGATLTMFLNKFNPQVRFDASVASSFHYGVDGDATGTLVSQWDDLSGNNNHFFSNITATAANYGSVGSVGGRNVFDAGNANSGIDLKLKTKITDTLMVFMVGEATGIAINKGYWLGCDDAWFFSPGNNGEFSDDVHGQISNLWQNAVKIANPTNEFPEPAGGLSVWTMQMKQKSKWNQFGKDRDLTGRNGGKRVAELVTFAQVIDDDARVEIERMLMEKWKPTEEYLDDYISAAAVHVDASSASNFTYTDGKITGWKNAGTGADLFRQAKLYIGPDPNTAPEIETGYGAYGFTNGVPAFLMGEAGSNIDMAFTRLTNIRTVFWAMDIERENPSAWFLGDWWDRPNNVGKTYSFSRGRGGNRGAKGAYAADGEAAVQFRSGTMFCDGALVNLTNDLPRTSTRVYDLVTSGNVTASSLSQDRYCSNGTVNRNGGRALSELIIFTHGVYGLTRIAIRNRLRDKWVRSCGWAGDGASEWGAGNYRVFSEDAEVPSAGAAASGIGFTKDATLGGGTLTLGDGGIFASEGVAATIEASLSGDLGVYGPGRVVLSAASSSVGALHLGEESTLVVTNGATLTVGSGTLASGAALFVEAGGTLGTTGTGATLVGGAVSLADGAALLFNFTECATAPVLSGAVVTVAGSSVNVKVASADGLRPSGSVYRLTSGIDFTGKTVSLVNSPKWVKGVRIVDGDIVVEIKPTGLMLIVK